MLNTDTVAVPDSWCGQEAAYPRDCNVAMIFEQQAARTPDAVAISWEGEHITYRELNARANRLAHALRKRGVGTETVVGIHLQRSPRLITALLAVCKAGGTYLPLDTTYPAERLLYMIRDAKAELVLTEACASYAAPASLAPAICLDRNGDELIAEPDANPPHLAAGTNRVYIMYTSGSAGQPKGIEILHRGVLRLVLNSNQAQLGPDDRVAQIANCSFDASTWEIWGALLNGACLVGVTTDVALSPNKLAALLDRERVTAVFLTTALFNLMAREAPSAFQRVRYLLTGGEVMVPAMARNVFNQGAPEFLFNVYGPTECTSYATWHHITQAPEDGQPVPIGRPLQNTIVRVLDAHGRACTVNETGELFIGGDGLARGYLNRPELTTERFVEDPLRPGRRLYKTGDLVRWLPSGVLDFVGRADQQVKIRGFRIELGEIESVLRLHPLVSEACVVARPGAEDHKRLAAYLVPTGGADKPVRDLQRMTEEVRTTLQRVLPPYMHPTAFCWLDRLPLTPNGKVDRGAPDLMSLPGYAESAAPPSTETEKRLAEVWSSVLAADRVSINDDFFDLGGDSLLAAQLMMRVSEMFDIEFPVSLFFEKPTLAELARSLDEMQFTGRGRAASTVNFAADAVLADAIRPEAPWDSDRSELNDVFLTGSTGFLGAFLLDRLLRRTKARVHCLVRARDAAEGLARIRATLRKYELEPTALDRVEIVPGDLTRPLFGLDENRFRTLAGNVNVIYHAAAHVSYVEPYARHKAANVDGTTTVLKLACAVRAKPLHYVSSIGVFGPVGYLAGVKDINEDADISISEQFLQMDMGYSMSKWVAEKLVFSARDRGLPVVIYRPGFIMGDSRTGATNRDDFMSRVIAGCLDLGSYPFLPNQRKEFVPVDYVSDALLHISLDRNAIGKIFHLCPPDPRLSIEFLDLFNLLGDLGYQLRMLSYAEWRDEVWSHVRNVNDSPLTPLLSVLSEKVYKDSLTRWEVHEGMPHFHAHNTNAFLQGSGIEFEPLGPAMLSRYLEFYAQLGMLELPESQMALATA